MTKTTTYFYPVTIVTLACALISSAIAGSFFGRVNTISCNKEKGVCAILSKGFLYTVYKEEISMNEIQSFRVEVMKGKSDYVYAGGKRIYKPPVDYYSLVIERGTTSPLRILENANVPVHDIFSYSLPVFKVADSLQIYLKQPFQNEISLTFGTHRTGYFFTLLIFGLLGWLVFSNGYWTLRYTARKSAAVNEFVKSEDVVLIDRTAYEVVIKKGFSDAWFGIVYMFKGSKVTAGKYLEVKHALKKQPERVTPAPLPRFLPQRIKEELENLKE